MISAASALWPSAEPFDDACSDRDDVLQGAANLDADHVAGCRRAAARASESAPCTASTTAGDRPAATTAVGSSRASSMAKLGPESTTTSPMPGSSARDDLATSAAASPLRDPSWRSTTVQPRGRCDAAARATSRRPCDGTAITMNAAPVERRPQDRRSASAPAESACRAGRPRFSRRASSSKPAPASRAHRRTSWPVRARCTASAVPQLPAPMTAIRVTHVPQRRARVRRPHRRAMLPR